MNLKVEQIDFQIFKGLEYEWNLLLSKSPSCSVFLDFDWLLLWWEYFNEQGYSFYTFTLRTDNKELIAILPLYLNKNTLMFLGTYWCNTKLCGLRYIVTLPKQNSNYLESLSTSFVKKINRAKNKFYKKLEGELTKINDQNEINLALETLQELHNKRWNGKGVQGAFSSLRFLKFHQKFSARKANKSQLQLWIFKASNQPIAALYAFDMFSIRYFYQCGIDDSFKPNLSPGSLMHFIAIEDAINNNLTNYDFMKGDINSSYKSNFAPKLVKMFHTKIIKKSFLNSFRMFVWKIKHFKRTLSI